MADSNDPLKQSVDQIVGGYLKDAESAAKDAAASSAANEGALSKLVSLLSTFVGRSTAVQEETLKLQKLSAPQPGEAPRARIATARQATVASQPTPPPAPRPVPPAISQPSQVKQAQLEGAIRELTKTVSASQPSRDVATTLLPREVRRIQDSRNPAEITPAEASFLRKELTSGRLSTTKTEDFTPTIEALTRLSADNTRAVWNTQKILATRASLFTPGPRDPSAQTAAEVLREIERGSKTDNAPLLQEFRQQLRLHQGIAPAQQRQAGQLENLLVRLGTSRRYTQTEPGYHSSLDRPIYPKDDLPLARLRHEVPSVSHLTQGEAAQLAAKIKTLGAHLGHILQETGTSSAEPYNLSNAVVREGGLGLLSDPAVQSNLVRLHNAAARQALLGTIPAAPRLQNLQGNLGITRQLLEGTLLSTATSPVEVRRPDADPRLFEKQRRESQHQLGLDVTASELSSTGTFSQQITKQLLNRFTTDETIPSSVQGEFGTIMHSLIQERRDAAGELSEIQLKGIIGANKRTVGATLDALKLEAVRTPAGEFQGFNVHLEDFKSSKGAKGYAPGDPAQLALGFELLRNSKFEDLPKAVQDQIIGTLGHTPFGAETPLASAKLASAKFSYPRKGLKDAALDAYTSGRGISTKEIDELLASFTQVDVTDEVRRILTKPADLPDGTKGLVGIPLSIKVSEPPPLIRYIEAAISAKQQAHEEYNALGNNLTLGERLRLGTVRSFRKQLEAIGRLRRGAPLDIPLPTVVPQAIPERVGGLPLVYSQDPALNALKFLEKLPPRKVISTVGEDPTGTLAPSYDLRTGGAEDFHSFAAQLLQDGGDNAFKDVERAANRVDHFQGRPRETEADVGALDPNIEAILNDGNLPGLSPRAQAFLASDDVVTRINAVTKEVLAQAKVMVHNFETSPEPNAPGDGERLARRIKKFAQGKFTETTATLNKLFGEDAFRPGDIADAVDFQISNVPALQAGTPELIARMRILQTKTSSKGEETAGALLRATNAQEIRASAGAAGGPSQYLVDEGKISRFMEELGLVPGSDKGAIQILSRLQTLQPRIAARRSDLALHGNSLSGGAFFKAEQEVKALEKESGDLWSEYRQLLGSNQVLKDLDTAARQSAPKKGEYIGRLITTLTDIGTTFGTALFQSKAPAVDLPNIPSPDEIESALGQITQLDARRTSIASSYRLFGTNANPVGSQIDDVLHRIPNGTILDDPKQAFESLFSELDPSLSGPARREAVQKALADYSTKSKDFSGGDVNQAISDWYDRRFGEAGEVFDTLFSKTFFQTVFERFKSRTKGEQLDLGRQGLSAPNAADILASAAGETLPVTVDGTPIGSRLAKDQPPQGSQPTLDGHLLEMAGIRLRNAAGGGGGNKIPPSVFDAFSNFFGGSGGDGRPLGIPGDLNSAGGQSKFFTLLGKSFGDAYKLETKDRINVFKGYAAVSAVGGENLQAGFAQQRQTAILGSAANYAELSGLLKAQQNTGQLGELLGAGYTKITAPLHEAVDAFSASGAAIQGLQTFLSPQYKFQGKNAVFENKYRLAEGGEAALQQLQSIYSDFQFDSADAGGGLFSEDQYQAVLKQHQAKIRKVDQTGADVVQKLQTRVGKLQSTHEGQGFLDRLELQLKRLSSYAIGGIFVYGALQWVQQMGAELQNLAKVAAHIQGIFGGKSLSQRLEIKQDILSAAAQYGQSISTTAAAYQIFAQAGFTREQAKAATQTTLQAAKGAGIEPQQATEFIIAARSLHASDVVPPDYTQLLDKLSNVSSQYAITAQDLAKLQQRVGSLAQELQPVATGGIAFDDLITGLGTAIVQQTRVSGDVAATSLRFMLSRLSAPRIVNAIQKNFGVPLGGPEGTNSYAPLSDILQRLAAKYQTLKVDGKPTAESQAFLTTFAGARQVAAAAVLFDKMNVVLEAATKSSESFGETLRRTTTAMDTVPQQFSRLSVSAQHFVSNLLDGGGGKSKTLQAASGIAGVLEKGSETLIGRLAIGSSAGIISVLANAGRESLKGFQERLSETKPISEAVASGGILRGGGLASDLDLNFAADAGTKAIAEGLAVSEAGALSRSGTQLVKGAAGTGAIALGAVGQIGIFLLIATTLSTIAALISAGFSKFEKWQENQTPLLSRDVIENSQYFKDYASKAEDLGLDPRSLKDALVTANRSAYKKTANDLGYTSDQLDQKFHDPNDPNFRAPSFRDSFGKNLVDALSKNSDTMARYFASLPEKDRIPAAEDLLQRTLNIELTVPSAATEYVKESFDGAKESIKSTLANIALGRVGDKAFGFPYAEGRTGGAVPGLEYNSLTPLSQLFKGNNASLQGLLGRLADAQAQGPDQLAKAIVDQSGINYAPGGADLASLRSITGNKDAKFQDLQSFSASKYSGNDASLIGRVQNRNLLIDGLIENIKQSSNLDSRVEQSYAQFGQVLGAGKPQTLTDVVNQLLSEAEDRLKAQIKAAGNSANAEELRRSLKTAVDFRARGGADLVSDEAVKIKGRVNLRSRLVELIGGAQFAIQTAGAQLDYNQARGYGGEQELLQKQYSATLRLIESLIALPFSLKFELVKEQAKRGTLDKISQSKVLGASEGEVAPSDYTSGLAKTLTSDAESTIDTNQRIIKAAMEQLGTGIGEVFSSIDSEGLNFLTQEFLKITPEAFAKLSDDEKRKFLDKSAENLQKFIDGVQQYADLTAAKLVDAVHKNGLLLLTQTARETNAQAANALQNQLLSGAVDAAAALGAPVVRDVQLEQSAIQASQERAAAERALATAYDQYQQNSQADGAVAAYAGAQNAYQASLLDINGRAVSRTQTIEQGYNIQQFLERQNRNTEAGSGLRELLGNFQALKQAFKEGTVFQQVLGPVADQITRGTADQFVNALVGPQGLFQSFFSTFTDPVYLGAKQGTKDGVLEAMNALAVKGGDVVSDKTLKDAGDALTARRVTKDIAAKAKSTFASFSVGEDIFAEQKKAAAVSAATIATAAAGATGALGTGTGSRKLGVAHARELAGFYGGTLDVPQGTLGAATFPDYSKELAAFYGGKLVPGGSAGGLDLSGGLNGRGLNGRLGDYLRGSLDRTGPVNVVDPNASYTLEYLNQRNVAKKQGITGNASLSTPVLPGLDGKLGTYLQGSLSRTGPIIYTPDPNAPYSSGYLNQRNTAAGGVGGLFGTSVLQIPKVVSDIIFQATNDALAATSNDPYERGAYIQRWKLDEIRKARSPKSPLSYDAEKIRGRLRGVITPLDDSTSARINAGPPGVRPIGREEFLDEAHRHTPGDYLQNGQYRSTRPEGFYDDFTADGTRTIRKSGRGLSIPFNSLLASGASVLSGVSLQGQGISDARVQQLLERNKKINFPYSPSRGVDLDAEKFAGFYGGTAGPYGTGKSYEHTSLRQRAISSLTPAQKILLDPALSETPLNALLGGTLPGSSRGSYAATSTGDIDRQLAAIYGGTYVPQGAIARAQVRSPNAPATTVTPQAAVGLPPAPSIGLVDLLPELSPFTFGNAPTSGGGLGLGGVNNPLAALGVGLTPEALDEMIKKGKRQEELRLAKENLIKNGARLAGQLGGAAVGGGGRGAQVGSSLGSIGGELAGAALKEAATVALGATLGSVVPVVGTIVGGLLGGLIGGLFDKEPPEPIKPIEAFEKIERNTRDTVTALQNQVELMKLDDRLLNVPTTFRVPDYTPLNVGNGSGGLASTAGGISVNIVINDARDPDAVAKAVSRELSSSMRSSGYYVPTR